MPSARDDQHLHPDVGGAHASGDHFGMLERDHSVRIAVDKQRGRVVGRDVVDRRCIPICLELARRSAGSRAMRRIPKSEPKVPWPYSPLCITRSVGGAHGTMACSRALSRLIGSGSSGSPVAENTPSISVRWPPDEPPTPPHALGVNAPARGVSAYEPHGSLDILELGGVLVQRRRAVVYREHRVAGLYQWRAEDLHLAAGLLLWRAGGERRVPAAPGDVHDPDSVRPAGTIDVHEQRTAGDHAKRDVAFDAGVSLQWLVAERRPLSLR